jgi:hypothetical protein
MKNPRWLLLFIGVTMAITGPDGRCQEPSPVAKANGLANTRIVIPKDTTIPMALLTALNSRTATVGQAIYCNTIFPITVGDRIVIPSGSNVKGTVTQVVRPHLVGGGAQLGLRFDMIILPSGVTRYLRGTLSGLGSTGNEQFKKDESKIKGASNRGEDAGKVAEQETIRGAEVGTVVGIATRSLGKGILYGSAVAAAGSAVGIMWILGRKGKEIVLAPGTNLELQLAAPLTFENDEVDPISPYQNGPALPRREPNR